ncbi:hypothetical protein QQS21_000611 [Conoideocrella luteorostrata]|uniref:Uncharacterized protein n=1 Tax=Conoideocrella luteorostrata TaxID=1105319 RepID=A0AAJ0FZ03_9HYPO|nr:hypothetical protein QQS21_000611 [Conoideocrella luteorostrata]
MLFSVIVIATAAVSGLALPPPTTSVYTQTHSDIQQKLHVRDTPPAPSPKAPSPQAPSPQAPSPQAPSPDIPSPQTPSPPSPTGPFLKTEYLTIPGVTNSFVTIPAKTVPLAVPTCIQTAALDENGNVPPGECGSLWNYYPSVRAAVALACLFALLVAVHVWQAVMFKKTWCWVIMMATIWETTALIFRTLSSKMLQNRPMYMIFEILILFAPLWVNAYVYITLGRMTHYFHPARSILNIPPVLVTTTFMLLVVAAGAIQLVGRCTVWPGSLYDDAKRALDIHMIGIGLQLFANAAFLVPCVTCHVQLSKLQGGRKPFGSMLNMQWGALFFVLYISLSMITIRMAYRLVEFSSALRNNGTVSLDEVLFYVLDVVPMGLAMLLFAVVHPGRVMANPDMEMPGLLRIMKDRRLGKKGHVVAKDDSDEERELVDGWRMRRDEMR